MKPTKLWGTHSREFEITDLKLTHWNQNSAQIKPEQNLLRGRERERERDPSDPKLLRFGI